MRRVRAHIPGWLRPAVLVAVAAVAGIAINVVLLGFGPPATDRVGKFKPELELAAPASAQSSTPTRRDDAGRKEQRRTVAGETSTTATASVAPSRPAAPIAPALDDTSGLATRDQQPGASDDD